MLTPRLRCAPVACRSLVAVRLYNGHHGSEHERHDDASRLCLEVVVVVVFLVLGVGADHPGEHAVGVPGLERGGLLFRHVELDLKQLVVLGAHVLEALHELRAPVLELRAAPLPLRALRREQVLLSVALQLLEVQQRLDAPLLLEDGPLLPPQSIQVARLVERLQHDLVLRRLHALGNGPFPLIGFLVADAVLLVDALVLGDEVLVEGRRLRLRLPRLHPAHAVPLDPPAVRALLRQHAVLHSMPSQVLLAQDLRALRFGQRPRVVQIRVEEIGKRQPEPLDLSLERFRKLHVPVLLRRCARPPRIPAPTALSASALHALARARALDLALAHLLPPDGRCLHGCDRRPLRQQAPPSPDAPSHPRPPQRGRLVAPPNPQRPWETLPGRRQRAKAVAATRCPRREQRHRLDRTHRRLSV
mmetsp:Transcript_7735/g.22327  ORF Transcript_7735/g.22327 Transcript_7735/m.22327 type:complete len:417 (+) Transcript_7735:134-1384(+)